MHVDISALTSICDLFVLHEKNVLVTEGASSRAVWELCRVRPGLLLILLLSCRGIPSKRSLRCVISVSWSNLLLISCSLVLSEKESSGMSGVEVLGQMNDPFLHHKQFHSWCPISQKLLKSHLMSVCDLTVPIKAEQAQSCVCSLLCCKCVQIPEACLPLCLPSQSLEGWRQTFLLLFPRVFNL